MNNYPLSFKRVIVPSSKCAQPAECTVTTRYPSFIESQKHSNDYDRARVGSGVKSRVRSGVSTVRTTSTNALTTQLKKTCTINNQRGKNSNNKGKDTLLRSAEAVNSVYRKAGVSEKETKIDYGNGNESENEEVGDGDDGSAKEIMEEKFMFSNTSDNVEGLLDGYPLPQGGKIRNQDKDENEVDVDVDEEGGYVSAGFKMSPDALLPDTVATDTEDTMKKEITARSNNDSGFASRICDIDCSLNSMTGSYRRNRSNSYSHSNNSSHSNSHSHSTRDLPSSRSMVPHTQESMLHRTRQSLSSSSSSSSSGTRSITHTHTHAHTGASEKHTNRRPSKETNKDKDKDKEKELKKEKEGKRTINKEKEGQLQHQLQQSSTSQTDKHHRFYDDVTEIDTDDDLAKIKMRHR